LWYHRLDGHDFSEEQFLFPPGIELFITSKDDVHGFRSILELHVVRFVLLVVLFGLFVRWLVLLAITGITECDEDMTRMDTNIIRTYLGRDMDDEYMICLCTTIRAKDKVSLFLYYLFTYFENRLLPKNIIIIRNHGDVDGALKDRHGV
jgi:hypothetical protein